VDGVAVVTGGGAGIGQGIAARLGEDGFTIAVLDVDPRLAEGTCHSILEAGGVAKVWTVDVRDERLVEEAIQEIDSGLGPIVAAVNCAGVLSTVTLMEMTLNEWDRVLDVNLKGTFLVARAAARRMTARGAGGRIVNIASEVGKTPQAGLAHYAASKAGVIAMSQALALELAADGITVNSVCPTLTETDMIAQHAADLARVRGGSADDWYRSFHELVPLGRMATPRDIAAVVAFLVSAEAGFVTGASYNVTGGRELH